MKTIQRAILAASCAFGILAGGCSGEPVELGSRAAEPVPHGAARQIEASACGFQLLLVIPIAINDRQYRAYKDLQDQAHGDYITDVKVQESWTYGFVGTTYCTRLTASAIARS